MNNELIKTFNLFIHFIKNCTTSFEVLQLTFYASLERLYISVYQAHRDGIKSSALFFLGIQGYYEPLKLAI